MFPDGVPEALAFKRSATVDIISLCGVVFQ